MTKLLIVMALVLFNAFFALSEMAVLTSRKSRLKQMAAHSAGARKALELANEPEKFLSAVQLWITALGMVIGLLGGESIGESIAVPLSRIPELAPYAHLLGLVSGLSLIHI